MKWLLVAAAVAPAEWGGAIELCWVRDKIPFTPGIPFFNEVVFCHTPSKTLFVTDLWWNYPKSGEDTTPAVPDVPLSSRLWKKGMDYIYRPVYNRLMDADGTRVPLPSYCTPATDETSSARRGARPPPGRAEVTLPHCPAPALGGAHPERDSRVRGLSCVNDRCWEVPAPGRS